MSHPPANNFRKATLAERMARVLPAGAALAPVRRVLKPLFERWLSRSATALESRLPGGEVVRAAPAYRHITWNAEEYAAFRGAVQAGDVVLEAGSNVGAYTMLFAQWAGPAGHVFAFEPDPHAFHGLQTHIALNGLNERVTAVQAAVADRDGGTLRFAMFGSSGISRLAGNHAAPGTTICEVQTTTIDRFCTTHALAPTVLKIDVEGAELAVLRGARATIAAAGARLRLFVEMHPQLWAELGISGDDLAAECDAQGLVAEHLDGSGDDLWSTEGVCLRLRPVR
jgi:FkbM family methyltransferase